MLLSSIEANEAPIGWGIFFYSGIVLVIIATFVILARIGMKERIPHRLSAQLGEHLYHYIEELCFSVIGHNGRKYAPFLMALWLFIFVGNMIGLIFPYTPTADLSMNLSLSLVTIFYVQYEGIRVHGFFGHLRHFAGPKLPILMGIFITPLLFSIEILSEVMKIVSLSLRLYSNIHGGHLVVSALNHLYADGAWPIGGFLLPLKLLAAIIQALVFTMLAGVYLSIVVGDNENQESEDHHVIHPASTAGENIPS